MVTAFGSNLIGKFGVQRCPFRLKKSGGDHLHLFRVLFHPRTSTTALPPCAPRAKEMLSKSEAGVLPLSMGRADAGAAYTGVRKSFTPKRAA